MARLLAAATLIFLLAGCRPAVDGETPSTRLPAPPQATLHSPDGWTLVANGLSPETRHAYLGNGYLGFPTGPTGCGWHGKATLPCYVAGLYANEVLTPVPSLAAPVLRATGGATFGSDPGHLSNYVQELSLRKGMLTTRATWKAGAAGAEVTVTCFPHRARRHLVVTRVRVRNTGSETLELVPADSRLGQQSLRIGTTRVRLFVGKSQSLPNVADMGANERVRPGWTGDYLHFGTVYTSLEGSDPAAADTRKATGYDALLREHERAWARLWEADIEIEGDPEAQLVARACRFYLLQSVRPELERGVPPMGLSAGAFNGHVFWDQESWMLPALLPQSPDLTRAMLGSRLRPLPGARANARAEGQAGAAYAWESAATGRETAPGQFRLGRHVNGDIALAVGQQWLATGDRDWLRTAGFPLLQATADYWTTRARKGPDGKYHIGGVFTPDESAGTVEDSAWTNHVARRNLELAARIAPLVGGKANPVWARIAALLEPRRDPQTGLIMEHAAYTGQAAKQADTLLLFHPGGLRVAKEELARHYDYYAPRVIRNGPAMTDAIHAVLAARLGRGEEALARFRVSYQPFLRAPFATFSEKRSRDNLCFLTGCGGVLQAILYGFAGLELADGAAPRAAPRLPPGWTALTLRGLQWRGKRYDLRVDGRGVEWTRR